MTPPPDTVITAAHTELSARYEAFLAAHPDAEFVFAGGKVSVWLPSPDGGTALSGATLSAVLDELEQIPGPGG